MILRYLKKYLSPESSIKRNRYYREAYKIEGHVESGENTFIFDGCEIAYSKAVLRLRIKSSMYDIDGTIAWESEEYRDSNEALNVLKAECGRISELIVKRIEVIEYSQENGKFEATSVYNSDNRQYILESTNI